MLSRQYKEDRIMIDSKDILTLLSIPCEEVSDVEIISDTKEITFIDIELKDNRSSCPFCFFKIILLSKIIIRSKLKTVLLENISYM